MAAPPHVSGFVAEGFEPVRDAFRDNFVRRGEVGASFCVVRRGERLVDLWAGLADVEASRPWNAGTISTLFSATKGLAATCLLMLADRGALDYDARVADYWPGFAAAGKRDVTVRTLLNHRAGLAALDTPVTLDDLEHRPEHVLDALERQAPLWAPGTDQGYHGVTFGTYAAALFGRITGTSLGKFLADEIAAPLGAEVHLGLPDGHGHDVATMYPADTWERLSRVVPKLLFDPGRDGRAYRAAARPRSDTQRAFRHPAELGISGLANFNTPRVHRMELAWANGLGNARGLATVYGALAGGGAAAGVRLVSRGALTPLRARQSWVTRDRVLRKPLGFSQGFIKEEPQLFSPSLAAFGHPGAGGTLGFADPDHELGIGYVMNKMTHHIRSPRAIALCHALYRCL